VALGADFRFDEALGGEKRGGEKEGLNDTNHNLSFFLARLYLKAERFGLTGVNGPGGGKRATKRERASMP
jgi:hypothetical protein